MGIIAAHQGQSARLCTPESPHPSEGYACHVRQPVETVEVSTASVACDGGPGALGHPKVYLNLAKDGQIDCPIAASASC